MKAVKTKNGYVVKRKARKTQYCEECGQDIEINEEYFRVVTLKQGCWESVPYCQKCVEINVNLNAQNKKIYHQNEVARTHIYVLPTSR